MQQRHLLWLIGALVLLLLIAFASGTFNREISTIDVPELSISKNEIEQLSISIDDSTAIELSRQQNGWSLVQPINARADSILLERLTDNISLLEIESVVSTNPDRYENYGVGEAAQRIIVSNNEEDKTLILGKSGPDYQSMYLRLEEDPRVFVTNGRINAPQDIDAWRDKTLINVPLSSLESVAVTTPEESYEVALSEMQWELTVENTSNAADSNQVALWLNRFSPLNATGFSDLISINDLKEEATHRLQLSSPGGITRTIWFLDGETEVLAATSEQDFVFRLTKSMLPRYIPESSSLVQGQVDRDG